MTFNNAFNFFFNCSVSSASLNAAVILDLASSLHAIHTVYYDYDHQKLKMPCTNPKTHSELSNITFFE